MELLIWIIAGLAGLVITVLALSYLAVKSIALGKKLQPFVGDLVVFRKNVERYPEAVSFLNQLTQGEKSPVKGPETGKD
jgi:hypothetical protein